MEYMVQNSKGGLYIKRPSLSTEALSLILSTAEEKKFKSYTLKKPSPVSVSQLPVSSPEMQSVFTVLCISLQQGLVHTQTDTFLGTYSIMYIFFLSHCLLCFRPNASIYYMHRFPFCFLYLTS